MSLLIPNKNTSKCEHKRTYDQIMPEGCIHYSKKVCKDCDRFIKWNPNPETIKQKTERDEKIDQIKKLNGLSSFEKSFVTSVQTQNHLTPKQTVVWQNICNKYNV